MDFIKEAAIVFMPFLGLVMLELHLAVIVPHDLILYDTAPVHYLIERWGSFFFRTLYSKPATIPSSVCKFA
jgi:hypothetical protein